MNDLYSAMVSACRDVGVTPPDSLPAPGKWHSLDVAGDSHGKGDGRVRLWPDGEGGIVCNWKSDETQTFFAGSKFTLSPEQKAIRHQATQVARIAADEERKAEQSKAAEKARALWEKAKPGDHAYLIRKKIKPSGAKVYKNALVIPMRSDGEIQSLQFINADGRKKFLSGGRVKGCYFSIGNTKGAATVCIVEGFATGASIHEATGLPVAVAFDAGNLEPVAKAMRVKFPNLPITLCADDDWKSANNPGITKATAAALSVGGLVAYPAFGNDRPEKATDFNDMASLYELEAVNRAIHSAQVPAMPECRPDLKGPPMDGYERTVELIRGSDITPEAVNWLWHEWIAAGKMHVLGGAPGTGKTTISMALAATVTVGGRWPDGTRSPVGNVVIWSGEDSPADTLVPRLTMSGADLSRVYFIADHCDDNGRRSFDPAKDMEPLQRKLDEIGDVRLLIVDPIVSAVMGDSHKNAEVRRSLQPLVDLAESMRCALLGITHFSKGTGGRDPVERLTGSLAFGALARVVLVAAKQQEDGEDGRTVRIFLRAKSNIGPDDGGFEYDLQQGELNTYPGVFSSYVLWGNALDGSARELLASADAVSDESGGDSQIDAKRFLADLLANGPISSKVIKADAEGAGYLWGSIRRAQKSLGVRAFKDGMKGGWKWEMPRRCTEVAEDAQTNSSCTFNTFAPVRTESGFVEVEI